MSLLFLLFIILKLCTSFSEFNIPADVYNINMDLPASVRWSEPCKKYGLFIAEIYKHVLKLFPDELATILEDIMLKWFITNAYEPYKSEMEYFAKCGQVPLGAIVTINLVYDLTALCTSIVAAYPNGTIIHARNLDKGELPLIRNMTLVGHYINNNSDILYSGTTWFGYVGLWTSIKPNGFSITGDTRNNGSTLVENIMNIHNDYYPPSWLMRDVAAEETTYENAKKRLINTHLMASVYMILGGLNYPDGCVITRNTTYSFELFELKTSYLGWYILETNYDWYYPPPKRDDRRDPAIQSMNQMTQAGMSPQGLFNVLSVYPVINAGTVYTNIFSASMPNLYQATVRFLQID